MPRSRRQGGAEFGQVVRQRLADRLALVLRPGIGGGDAVLADLDFGVLGALLADRQAGGQDRHLERCALVAVAGPVRLAMRERMFRVLVMFELLFQQKSFGLSSTRGWYRAIFPGSSNGPADSLMTLPACLGVRAILALVLALLPLASALARPFTARDLVMLDRASDPQVSPDGRLLAFTVRRTDLPANRGV